MKKLTSKLLLFVMLFSFTFGNIPITVKADENKNNVETVDSKDAVETKTNQDLIEKNTKAGMGIDYNALYFYGKLNKTYSGEINLFNSPQSVKKLNNSEVNMIVMLIDFPESESDPDKGKVTVNSTYTDAQIETLDSAFFKEGKSLKDYISTVSGGKCSVNPVLTYNNNNNNNVYVYTAEHPVEYYQPYSTSNPTGYKDGEFWGRTKLITKAFSKLKKYIPSNLDLDIDDNGYIDSISFFVPHCDGWDDFLWSYAYEVIDTTQSVNGAKLRYYNQITYNYNNLEIYKTIIHEYMHIIGFPDLYVYNNGTYPDPFDSWSMMTYGTTGYPTVWERMRYGEWINSKGVSNIVEDGEYLLSNSTLDSNSNTIAYKVEVPNSDEFFMIEYRDKNGNSYEKDNNASGIIAYRVDPNKCGNASGDPEMYLMRNESQKCYQAYLDGTTGHKTMNLTLSSGECVGRIEYLNTINGQAKFKINKNIEIKDIDLSFANGKKVENNEFTLGSRVYIGTTVGFAQGDVTYTYTVKDSNGDVTTLSSSTNSNTSWQPKEKGNYVLTVTVKDATSIKSKSIHFTVNDKIKIISSNIDKVSPQVVGTKITASVDVTGGTGNKKCIAIKAQGGNYQFGSKELYFKMTGDFTGYWIPDTDGNYNIYATIQDETGSTFQYKIATYIVEKNQVTIYYSGYSNPYIHYQIGNGSWTKAPGVEMESSDDVSGYSYKMGIDLGDADKLTACFNDGNGSWDNNSGNDYKFTAGYYTVKDGVVTKIRKPEKSLTITSLTSNYPKGITGCGSVNLNVIAENAQGDVIYTYYDIAEDGTISTIKSNTTSSSIYWIPNSYGKHTIKVTATDGVKTAIKTMEILVNKYVSASISGNETIYVGDSSEYKVNATGGTGKLTYTFYYTQWPSYTETILQSGTNNKLTWIPKETGMYQLYYKISDEGGYTSQGSYMSVIVKDKPLEISSITSNKGSVLKEGETTTFTVNAKGGSGKYTYNLYTHLYGSGRRLNLLSGSNSSSGSWAPDHEGTITIYAEVIDSNGNKVTYSQDFEVKKVTSNKTVIYYKGYDNPYIHYKIGNGSWTSAPGVKMDSNSDVSGYDYSITIDLGESENLIACFNNGYGSWDSNNGSNYSFGSGYYTYSNGVITPIDEPSKELKIKSISSSAGSTIKFGESTELKINASGGEGSYKYTLYYSAYGSGRTIYLLNESTNNTALYTPDYPKETMVTAVVEDASGNSVTYSQYFNCKQVTENEITIYYKGYDNAYIHYKVGNGSWTSAPGVAMTKTSEKAGYTHKVTIDLGEEESLTACFNNGSGSWDSNNGSNYVFNGEGIYSYSNGSINKIS